MWSSLQSFPLDCFTPRLFPLRFPFRRQAGSLQPRASFLGNPSRPFSASVRFSSVLSSDSIMSFFLGLITSTPVTHPPGLPVWLEHTLTDYEEGSTISPQTSMHYPCVARALPLSTHKRCYSISLSQNPQDRPSPPPTTLRPVMTYMFFDHILEDPLFLLVFDVHLPNFASAFKELVELIDLVSLFPPPLSRRAFFLPPSYSKPLPPPQRANSCSEVLHVVVSGRLPMAYPAPFWEIDSPLD